MGQVKKLKTNLPGHNQKYFDVKLLSELHNIWNHVFETFVTLDDIVYSNECTNVSHTRTHTHICHIYTHLLDWMLFTMPYF